MFDTQGYLKHFKNNTKHRKDNQTLDKPFKHLMSGGFRGVGHFHKNRLMGTYS